MQLNVSSTKIWIYNQTTDFRKAIDGLYELVHSQFETDLHEDIFVFFNRQGNKLKLLAWHGNGFILLYKRLEKGRFTFSNQKGGICSINEKQLSWLIAGLDWVKMTEWKTLEYSDFY